MLIALQNTLNVCLRCFFHRASHSLFSKEAVIVTKVDQSLVVDCKAAETIFHCKALKIKIRSKINVGCCPVCFTATHFRIDCLKRQKNLSCHLNKFTLVVPVCKTTKQREVSHLQVYFCSSSSHLEAEGWYINPTITFPKDEEVILCELWELGKETLHGPIIVLGDLREEHMN